MSYTLIMGFWPMPCSHSSLVKREMMGCGPDWLGQEILGFHLGNIIMDFLAHFGMRYMCM